MDAVDLFIDKVVRELCLHYGGLSAESTEYAVHQIVVFLSVEGHRRDAFARIPSEWRYVLTLWGDDPDKSAFVGAWLCEEIQKRVGWD